MAKIQGSNAAHIPDGASYLASGLGECTRLRQLRLGCVILLIRYAESSADVGHAASGITSWGTMGSRCWPLRSEIAESSLTWNSMITGSECRGSRRCHVRFLAAGAWSGSTSARTRSANGQKQRAKSNQTHRSLSTLCTRNAFDFASACC
eukprot:2876587-Rhodomonas_salina.3